MLEFYPDGDATPEKMMSRLYEEFELFTAEESGAFISAGRMYLKLENILASYREAREAYSIGRVLWGDKRCFYYPMLSAYCALLDADRSAIDLSYMQMLDSNQAKLSFDGIETLEAYIENGSYKNAAAKLYVHENTLRYRIQKLSDFLHLDLTDGAVISSLIVQIKLFKLMGRGST
jgi:carbohydrate diacid regulator